MYMRGHVRLVRVFRRSTCGVTRTPPCPCTFACRAGPFSCRLADLHQIGAAVGVHSSRGRGGRGGAAAHTKASSSLASAISSPGGLYGIVCGFTSKTSKLPTKPSHPKNTGHSETCISKARFLTAPYMCAKQRCGHIVASTQASEQASNQASNQATKQPSKQEERGRRGREPESPHQETAPQKTLAVPVNIRHPACWTSDLEKLSGPLLDLGPIRGKISGHLLDLPASRGLWFQMWAPCQWQ